MNEKKDYTGYEYKQVITDRTMESLWRDSMENFGWMADRSEAKIVKRMPFALWIMAAPLSLLPWRPFQKQLSDHASDREVEITFKRDWKISQKQELNQLETRFESSARAIESLEATKGMKASIISSAVGLLGTACLAVSTFAYLAGMTPAFILAAIPGFLGWMIPFFLYRKLKDSREKEIALKIEEQQETIYRLCQSGNELLHKSAAV